MSNDNPDLVVTDHAYPHGTALFADDHTPDPAHVSAFAADEDDNPEAHMGEPEVGA